MILNDCRIGIKQGDCLSPTLFAIFINDPVLEIKKISCGLGIEPEEHIKVLVNVLLHADDIVLHAGTELETQSMLDV